MSYQVGNLCYADTGSALAAMAASVQPLPVTFDDVAYIPTVVVSGTSLRYTFTPVASGNSTYSKTITPVLPVCQQLEAADGVAVGWLLVAVMSVAFSFAAMRRAAR